MEEPPAKRPRRTDTSATWDRNDASKRGTASPHSPRPHASDRDVKSRHRGDSRAGGHSSRREDDRRRKSRSPLDRHERSRRTRSRSPKQTTHKERERDRDKDRDRVKDQAGRRDRERSRDRDRNRSSRDYKPDRKRDRSRSPRRDGESNSSARQRSPPRSRIKHEDKDSKDVKDTKPATNGTPSASMDVDDNDADAMMKRMMGFASFKSTQNTKVPGNQIYGVRKEKKTEYRQYMNRVGGFNRPLSPG